MPIIEIDDLFFKRNKKVIFDKISLRIIEGKIVAIMGPSGCGKTTLLKLIGMQLFPNYGLIKINGKNVNNIGKKERLDLKKSVGISYKRTYKFTRIVC